MVKQHLFSLTQCVTIYLKKQGQNFLHSFHLCNLNSRLPTCYLQYYSSCQRKTHNHKVDLRLAGGVYLYMKVGYKKNNVQY